MNRALAFPLLCLCTVRCANPKRPIFEIRQDAATTYYDLGDLVRASGMARQALEIEPNDVKTLSILGMALTRMGASMTNANDVVTALNDAIATFMKAENCGGSDNFVVCFGHGTARTQRARMYLLRAEANEKRVSEAMDPKTPKNVDLLATPEQINAAIDKLRADNVGDRETAKTDLDIAVNRLLKAYGLNTAYLETMEHLQALYMLRMEFDSAVEWGERSMELLTREREATADLLRRPNLTIEGLNMLRDNMRKYDVQEVNGRSLLALAYQRLGNNTEALLDLDRALTLNPDRVEEYFNRGVARQSVRDYTGAALDYEAFLRRSTQPAESPIIRETWDRLNLCRKEAAARAASSPLGGKK